MKLHTSLTSVQVSNALRRAKDKGLITEDVHFTVFRPERSMTHLHGFEIQLGTYNQDSLPAGYTDQNGRTLRVRRARNASHGDARWAATWHEWGWLIAEIFAMDPGARWGANPVRCTRPEYAPGYAGPEDFHAKTEGRFRRDPATARRLEEIRASLRAENISYGELAELQALAPYIDPGDTELLEPAGVPEFPSA